MAEKEQIPEFAHDLAEHGSLSGPGVGNAIGTAFAKSLALREQFPRAGARERERGEKTRALR